VLRAALAALGAAAAGLASAQATELVSGPGVGLVNAKCGTCHDVTHISRSKLTREEWTDNFDNMLKRGMPPTSADERRIILEYLVAYYGPNPAPAPAPDTLADAAARSAGIDPKDRVGELLNKSGCTACHASDQPLVGPSFKAIADRYRSDGAAAPKLATKVKQGSVGTWGRLRMPAHPELSDADLNTMVAWVLAR
jgi:cytochrome c551/c552